MTANQIKALVREYVSSSLAFCEQSRAISKISDDKRKAIGCILTHAIELTRDNLLRDDFSDMLETADELLQAHQVQIIHASPDYHRLCRELLIAREGLLLTELDRNDGNYWGEHLSTSILAGSFGQAGCSRGVLTEHLKKRGQLPETA